jgi:cytochrome c oxidase assembly protein subunit 15
VREVATIPELTATPPLAGRGHDRFRRFAWCVLAWNILVVLWGAYVRATGSGAGCGNHWPLCNGEVLPRAPRAATIIEFTHRMTSGVALLAVIALCIWAFRQFPKNHVVRRTATLSVAFLLMEALLGAGLVLFAYVDKNASVGRAIYLSAHLVNTQLLLAVLTLTAIGSWLTATRRLGLLAIALVVSVTGAMAALGDTLFPSTSLAAGLQSDFSTTAHFLLRLRIVHPILAVAAGVFFALTALSVIRRSTSTQAKTAAWAVALLVVLQLYAGAMNLLLLAPVWMQIVHLLLADLLWIGLVVMTAVRE